MQANLDAGLRMFADAMFDTVVLSQTLQAMHNVEAFCARWRALRGRASSAFPTSATGSTRRRCCRPHAGYAADPVPVVRHAQYSSVHVEGLRGPRGALGTEHHRPRAVRRWPAGNVLPALRATLAIYRFEARQCMTSGKQSATGSDMNQALRDKLIRNIDDFDGKPTKFDSPLYEGVRSAHVIGRARCRTWRKNLGAASISCRRARPRVPTTLTTRRKRCSSSSRHRYAARGGRAH